MICEECGMAQDREQIIDEIDTKIKYAKFTNTDAVILSTKAAQFCLEHAQYYEQKIKELTEELTRKETEYNELYELSESYRKELVSVRADTVRKMQERVEKAICDNTYPDFNKEGKPVNVWKATTGYDVIDQIAKEMLEGVSDGK